jgi:hypothetical protein
MMIIHSFEIITIFPYRALTAARLVTGCIPAITVRVLYTSAAPKHSQCGTGTDRAPGGASLSGVASKK